MPSNDVVVTREFYIIGSEHRIRLNIYRPVSTAKDGIFRCRVEIEGAPDDLNGIDASGEDSLQAMLHALKMAKAMLSSMNQFNFNSNMRWLSDSDPSLNLE
ncbi:MAG: hypothetical protein JNJ49_08025 [Bdellovibrionaceae bacterium]|nr:hypothetical protein [Pseudobdellovibrionaceae bacterium]